MDEKIYKITLADGTVIDNLRLNGNNYISDKELTADMFLGNLAKVIVNDGESYAVTSIKDNAFDGCVNLTDITIPNSVTTIGGLCFL